MRKKYKSKVISHYISNFRVLRNGTREVKVQDSKINTPFGIIDVEGKTFSDIQNFDFLILQLNFSIEKTTMLIPVEDVPGAICGRLYKSRYTGLSAEFLLARPSGESAAGQGVLFDTEFEQPYSYATGPEFEIYYLPIARFEVRGVGQDTEKMVIKTCQSEKLNIPFFANYYGIGSED